MAILRHTHDLAGNSGTVPDALKLVLGSNAVLAGTDQRVRIENNKDGQYLARLVYHRQETTAPDGSTQVQVSIDGEDRGRLPEVINGTRKRYGLNPLDGEDLEQAVADALRNAQMIEKPIIHGTLEVDMLSFRPGLLKIAYELAFIWFGEVFLDRPEAEEMRKILRRGKELNDSTLKFGFHIGNSPPFDIWAYDQSHLALSMKSGGQAVVAVRLFKDLVGVVCVGTAAELTCEKFLRSDFLARTTTHSTMRKECYLLSKRKNRILLRLTTGLTTVPALVAEWNRRKQALNFKQ